MTLPTLQTPEFETSIPSSKEPIKFRPFLVKEEKILYMALESKDSKSIFNAVISILESCILTKGIDFDALTSYDLEFLFLQLRAKSVGERVDIRLNHSKDVECNNSTKATVALEDLNIKYDDSHDYKVDLGDGIGLKMRDPRAKSIATVSAETNDMDRLLSLIYECIEVAYDKEEVYDSFTREELITFLESLTKDQFEKITDFFNTAPKLTHEIEFTCEECGVTETVRLEGLQSFFT